VPDEPNVAKRDQVRAERKTGQRSSRVVALGNRLTDQPEPFTIAPLPSRPIASPATAATRLSTGCAPPGLLTPADVHRGRAEQRFEARAAVLAAAHAVHLERFPAGPPHPPARSVEVWINPPKIAAPLQTSSAILPSPLARAGAFA
jgi:hypothetical protein